MAHPVLVYCLAHKTPFLERGGKKKERERGEERGKKEGREWRKEEEGGRKKRRKG